MKGSGSLQIWDEGKTSNRITRSMVKTPRKTRVGVKKRSNEQQKNGSTTSTRRRKPARKPTKSGLGSILGENLGNSIVHRTTTAVEKSPKPILSVVQKRSASTKPVPAPVSAARSRATNSKDGQQMAQLKKENEELKQMVVKQKEATLEQMNAHLLSLEAQDEEIASLQKKLDKSVEECNSLKESNDDKEVMVDVMQEHLEGVVADNYEIQKIARDAIAERNSVMDSRDALDSAWREHDLLNRCHLEDALHTLPLVQKDSRPMLGRCKWPGSDSTSTKRRRVALKGSHMLDDSTYLMWGSAHDPPVLGGEGWADVADIL